MDTCPNELIALAEESGKKYAMSRRSRGVASVLLRCESGCEDGAITVTSSDPLWGGL